MTRAGRSTRRVWRSIRISSTFLAVMLAGATTFSANVRAQVKSPGVVSMDAAVYLLPDGTRTPLATVPAGTQVIVLEVQTEWLQVTFPDRAGGQRTGWIRRAAVTLGAPPPGSLGGGTIPPTLGKQPRAPLRARPAPEPLGIRGFARYEFTKLHASQSFAAVAGRDTFNAYGGGVQVTNVWRRFFIEVGADRMSIEGERVFVFEREAFPLGIPLEITTTAVDVIAGWRSRAIRRVLVPFVGGGVTFMRYEEVAQASEPDEDVDERGSGFVGIGGIEVIASKWVRIAGHARYRHVPDLLGAGGASAAFDETNLGGFGGGLAIVIGR